MSPCNVQGIKLQIIQENISNGQHVSSDIKEMLQILQGQ